MPKAVTEALQGLFCPGSKGFFSSYSVRSCQEMFKKLGYSRVRPQPFPAKGHEDSEARETFKKNC